MSGVWDHHHDEFNESLAVVTRSLAASSLPRRLEEPTGSIAAVALSLLRQGLRPGETTDRSLRYRDVADAVTYLLLAFDPDLVATYTEHLRNENGGPLDPDEVLAHAEHLLDPDAVQDAADVIRSVGWDVHRHGRRLLHVVGAFGNPALAAHRAIAAAEDVDLVGMWVANLKGGWSFIAWSRPDLIRVDHADAGLLWRHYRLEGLMGPGALASEMRTDPRVVRDYEIDHIPLIDASPEALTLIKRLGLDRPDLPAHCPG